MEEKKIELTCSLCGNRSTCNTRCTPVCAKFTLDKEAIDAIVKKTVAKTTGLTWKEAEKEALMGRCIRRKAWGEEAFVWRREMRTLSPDTNDPYVREACRRAGSFTLAEGACFAKLDYDSRCKGLPRVILHWMPADENDLNATDWEVFDVPVTYEDREVKVESALEHILRNPGAYSDKEKIEYILEHVFRNPGKRSDKDKCVEDIPRGLASKFRPRVSFSFTCGESGGRRNKVESESIQDAARPDKDDEPGLAEKLKKLFDGLDETAEIMKSLDDLLK